MATKITVKSDFLSDLRRFSVNTQITLNEFVETVSNLYKLENVRLKYRDEDEDLITITNDSELQEAFEFAKANKNFLRIVVTIASNSSLLDSWVVIDKLPEEVREICQEIKSLTDQLRSSQENVQQNNNNAVMSPTAAFFLNSNNDQSKTNENSSSILSAELPSWGKNSMYSEDFAREISQLNNGNNNNNNNNNNNGLIDGVRTDLMFQPKPVSKISQVVADNSATIVKDLKALTSKIANLVIQSGTDIPLDVKDDLIQTNMKLAEMTIANCQTYSNNAMDICNQYSDLALDIVNSAVDNQKKRNVELEESKQCQSNLCDSLRTTTIQNCTNLSNATTENCLRGANSIRDLIMNL